MLRPRARCQRNTNATLSLAWRLLLSNDRQSDRIYNYLSLSLSQRHFRAVIRLLLLFIRRVLYNRGYNYAVIAAAQKKVLAKEREGERDAIKRGKMTWLSRRKNGRKIQNGYTYIYIGEYSFISGSQLFSLIKLTSHILRTYNNYISIYRDRRRSSTIYKGDIIVDYLRFRANNRKFSPSRSRKIRVYKYIPLTLFCRKFIFHARHNMRWLAARILSL